MKTTFSCAKIRTISRIFQGRMSAIPHLLFFELAQSGSMTDIANRPHSLSGGQKHAIFRSIGHYPIKHNPIRKQRAVFCTYINYLLLFYLRRVKSGHPARFVNA